MRIFYLLIEKEPPLVAQFINWSHYVILMSLSDINEINYFIKQITIYQE